MNMTNVPLASHKNNIIHVIFSIILLFSTTTAFAAIGLPQSTARIGASLNLSYVKISEPDGASPESERMIPITLIATDWLPMGNRYWFEFINGQASYGASNNAVGQNLDYTALNLVVQRNIPLNKHVKPWFGAGLSLSRSLFRTRHTKTSDGFLIDSFEDRARNSLGILFNTTIDFELERNWFLGFKAEQTFNPKLSIDSFGSGIYILHLL